MSAPSIPYTPEPGWYAISATSRRLGTVWSNTDLYSYFRDKDPIAQAGYSIGLYEVKYPPDMPVTRDRDHWHACLSTCRLDTGACSEHARQCEVGR